MEAVTSFLSMTWAVFARELLQKLSCDLHELPKACGQAGPRAVDH